MEDGSRGIVDAHDGLRKRTGQRVAQNIGCESNVSELLAKRQRLGPARFSNNVGVVASCNATASRSSQGWSSHRQLLRTVESLAGGNNAYTRRGFMLRGSVVQERILSQIPFDCVVAVLGEPIRMARDEGSSSFDGAWLNIAQSLAWRCATVVLTVRQNDSRMARAGSEGGCDEHGQFSRSLGVGEWEGLLEDEEKLRAEAIAWHAFAGRPADVAAELRGVSKERVVKLCAQIQSGCGSLLRREEPTVVPISGSDAGPAARARIGFERGDVGRFVVKDLARRALVVYPEAFALHAALENECFGSLSDKGRVFTSSAGLMLESNNAVAVRYLVPEYSAGGHTEVLVAAGQVLVRVTSSARKLRQQDANETSILGARVLSRAELQPRLVPGAAPPFSVTNVQEKRQVWFAGLKGLIDRPCRTVLEGKYLIPKANVLVDGFDLPNLPSVQLDPDLIERLILRYLGSGALEFCGLDERNWPQCICPLSLVPKPGGGAAEGYRLVVDLRGVNKATEDWPSTMQTLTAAAPLLMSPGCFAWSRDLKSAYHLVPLGGCAPGRIMGDGRTAEGEEILAVGCKPTDGSCSKMCDKSLCGMRAPDGKVYRFAVPHFGAKTSGNALQSLVDPFVKNLRQSGTNTLVWCDDFLFTKENSCASPLTCGGVDCCADCANSKMLAEEDEKAIDIEMDRLGLVTSDKDTHPSQVGLFTGIHFDTRRGVLYLDEIKAAGLAAAFGELVQQGRFSRREVARSRGKLMWYSGCLSNVSLLSREMNRFIGSPEDWDAVDEGPERLIEELSFWRDHIVEMARVAKPIWQASSEQLRSLWEEGHHSVRYAIFTDASSLHWGAQLYERGKDLPVQSADGSYPAGLQFHEQAQREAAASLLGVRAFADVIAGEVVLHLSDCVCVVAACAKGSAGSIVLQDIAKLIWQETAAISVDLYSAWVPGTVMLSNKTDYLSRDGGHDHHGLTASTVLFNKACRLSERTLGGTLDVDYFASDTTARLLRFWSARQAVGCEGVDALQARCWGRSACDNCGEIRKDLCWLFPPTPLIAKVVAKAKADHAAGVMLVPRRTGAVWYPVLLHGMVDGGLEMVDHPLRDITLPDGPRFDSDPRGSTSSRWCLVAFDFSSKKNVSSDHPLSTESDHQCLQDHVSTFALHKKQREAALARSIKNHRMELLLWAALLDGSKAKEGIDGY